MIDRIRLTATAKNQLITLKRKTGLQHYNSFCRHALCLSDGFRRCELGVLLYDSSFVIDH